MTGRDIMTNETRPSDLFFQKRVNRRSVFKMMGLAGVGAASLLYGCGERQAGPDHMARGSANAAPPAARAEAEARPRPAIDLIQSEGVATAAFGMG